jgi:hypothetical protein
MMRRTHDCVLLPNMLPPGLILNVFIESFAIHARALIEFLDGTHRRKARHFTIPSYKPFASGRLPTELKKKLNGQIAHITDDRYEAVADKLNGKDIAELRRRLDPEIDEFVRHLAPRYWPLWDAKHHLLE